MRIDHQTLADLEIMESSDGGPGLFDLIDRTTTSFGRAALRRRFKWPLVDPAEIRATQEVVRWLRDNPGQLRVSGASMDAVDRYLRSNVVVSSGSRVGMRLEQVWMSLRYRDLLREMGSGVRLTRELLAAARSTAARIAPLEPPPLLASLVKDLGAAVDAALARAVDAESVLEADEGFRQACRKEIRDVLLLLGELDCLYSMADATEAFGWSMPAVLDTGAFVLEAEGIRHPFLSTGRGNPINLVGGEALVFLTGPNMAGKTTYLRSVALVPFLAQIGMGVPADRARLTPVEILMTSINPRDNLREGISYFMSEVLRVREAAEAVASGARCLVLFDEVFKGTNVKDALESSAEVITGLGRAARSGFLFSSHLAELGETLRGVHGVQLRYFDGEVDGGEPRFDYHIRSGISSKRFGRILLDRAGVPELLRRIEAEG
jgi:DNA mismatch repair protein MutS